MYNKPTFVKGALSVDERGELLFCNDFDMKSIRRFYQIRNHGPRFIRAWHGHKEETKFFSVSFGAALVAAVKIENWDSPDKNRAVDRFILSDKEPGILAIPPGYANGSMTLAPETRIVVFSDRTLAESKGDDYRYDAHYWNPWTITER